MIVPVRGLVRDGVTVISRRLELQQSLAGSQPVPVRVKEEPAVGFDHTKKEKKNMGVCLFFQTPK